MKTYKLTIKKYSALTHLIGDVVVMANTPQEARVLATEVISSSGGVPEDFEEPVEYTQRLVAVPTKSAWDNYH